MKDDLPKKVNKYETGIVNLDNTAGKGTHWVAYRKENSLVTYFDSYGDLRPPEELIKYFFSDGGVNIQYNYNPYQRNSYICGQLALNYLYNQFK
jgi:hypothetical protein